MEELYADLIRYREIFLPIKRIDDITVNTRMYMSTNNWGEEPSTIFYFEASLHDGTQYVDAGSTYENFCTMIEGLKDMKFSVLLGEFQNPNKLSKCILYKRRIMPMFHHPNIEMDYSDCSVCFETTYSKTKCSHSLCMRCHQRLKVNVCPVCRASLAWEVD